MFIPLKMVLIGIDPYPNNFYSKSAISAISATSTVQAGHALALHVLRGWAEDQSGAGGRGCRWTCDFNM